MTFLVSSRQMRWIEARAIEAGRATEWDLMKRAGVGAADAIVRHLDEMQEDIGHFAVLCGPGNNGGDGFVIARRLLHHGFPVSAWELGGPEGRSEASRRARDEWLGLRNARSISEFDDHHVAQDTVVIDALFGTGLSRPLPTVASDALSAGLRRGKVIAVDILSGLDSDSGAFHGNDGFPPKSASLTVTFESPKLGHFLGDGVLGSGEVRTVSIGLADECSDLRTNERCTRLFDPNCISLTSVLDKRQDRHKYEYGHVLVMAGGRAKGGAARLAARAALRIGAGLVTVGVPEEALAENAARLDAIMIASVSTAKDLGSVLEDPRIDVLCLGPGMGVSDRSRDLIITALKASRRVVLDADALTSFAGNPERLFGNIDSTVVMTPHMGEFRALFSGIFDSWSKGDIRSKVDAVARAAALSGATVLLKGHDTVVATPEGDTCILSTACNPYAPWLATAGSGDVLSGLISGLLARGCSGKDAATIGAWIHAEAAREFGPGLTAEDLPGCVPAVLRRICGDAKPV